MGRIALGFDGTWLMNAQLTLLDGGPRGKLAWHSTSLLRYQLARCSQPAGSSWTSGLAAYCLKMSVERPRETRIR